MKAAVFYEVRQPLRIEELEMPDVNDEDVLIKTFACGVCHTDLKVVDGRNRLNPPTVLGHEVSGTIERVGSRCTEFFKEGDAVIIGMRYKCGRCRYCLGGVKISASIVLRRRRSGKPTARRSPVGTS